MNKIAHDFKMQLIKSSAVPLHERKAKAEKEKTEPPTFKEMLINAAVSHATGIDASHETEETATASAEKTETIELSAAVKAASSDFMEKVQGTIAVPVGKNELPKFMEYLEKALENGIDLADALTKWSHNKTGWCDELDSYKCRIAAGSVIFEQSDWFHIDPNTGEIKHASPPGIHGILRLSGWIEPPPNSENHEKAVQDLAKDLQKFLRYTFFKQEDDCADEIDRILEELKARQEGKCMCRFDEVSKVVLADDFISHEDITYVGDMFTVEKKSIDELIEMLRQHQNKLYDEWKYVSASSQYIYSQLQ
jgi:hypothetical protein